MDEASGSTKARKKKKCIESPRLLTADVAKEALRLWTIGGGDRHVVDLNFEAGMQIVRSRAFEHKLEAAMRPTSCRLGAQLLPLKHEGEATIKKRRLAHTEPCARSRS